MDPYSSNHLGDARMYFINGGGNELNVAEQITGAFSTYGDPNAMFGLPTAPTQDTNYSVPSTFMNLDCLQSNLSTTTDSDSGYTNDPISHNNINYYNESVGIGPSSAIDIMVAAVPSVDIVANSVQHEVTQGYPIGQQACDPIDLTDQHDEMTVSLAEQCSTPKANSTKRPRSQTPELPLEKKPRVSNTGAMKLKRQSKIPSKSDIQSSSLQTTMVSQVDNRKDGEALFYSVPLSSIEKAIQAIQIDINSAFYKENAFRYPKIQLNPAELFRKAHAQFYNQPCKVPGGYDKQNFELHYLKIFPKNPPKNGMENVIQTFLCPETKKYDTIIFNLKTCHFTDLKFSTNFVFYFDGCKNKSYAYNFAKNYEWYALARLFVNAYGTHDGKCYSTKPEFTKGSQPKIEQTNFDNAVSWIETFSGLGRFSDMFFHELALALKKDSVDEQCFKILAIVLIYLYNILDANSDNECFPKSLFRGQKNFSKFLSMFTNGKEHRECQCYFPKPNKDSK